MKEGETLSPGVNFDLKSSMYMQSDKWICTGLSALTKKDLKKN